MFQTWTLRVYVKGTIHECMVPVAELERKSWAGQTKGEHNFFLQIMNHKDMSQD